MISTESKVLKLILNVKLFLIAIIFLSVLSCQQQRLEEKVTKPKSGKVTLREQLLTLMALTKNRNSTFQFTKTKVEEHADYIRYRVVIYPEPGDSIPAFYLEPKNQNEPFPVMICLQGHAPGMYISIGEAQNERDEKLIAGGRDIALQAIEQGWGALTVEQRGFGEQAVDGISCNHLSLNMAMQGQPMVGKRVSDISYAIDFLQTQKNIDLSRLGCMGNSAGGTISYFAAAVDERIKLSVVSCSFCKYEKSWLKYPHCACGYLPELLQYADMPDLGALIAPRHLLIVAGKKDYLADIDGVREGYRVAKGFYDAKNAADHILLVEGEDGHQFYPDLAWPLINSFREDGGFE